MLRDYYVPKHRSEAEIAATALKWRHAAGVNNLSRFNIVRFIEGCLQLLPSKEKGQLKIQLYPSLGKKKPAYVTYNPLTLHIEEAWWEAAKHEDPKAIYVIAHEIGHIVLHDHYLRPFSNSSAAQISFAHNEHSSEWQANTFAAHFLLPEHIVLAFMDFQSLSASCGLEATFVIERLEAVKANRARQCSGESCPECANFTLVRNGTCLKCDTCGSTTGCS